MQGTQRIPKLRQTVIDCIDARAVAEFYRQLLEYDYRAGDEPPAAGERDPRGRDWLVLLDAAGVARLAFQQVSSVAPATWPDGPVPQQLHLDMTVTTTAELDAQHERALALGARSSTTGSTTRWSRYVSTQTRQGIRSASS